MTRFLIVWIVLAVCIYAYRYLFGKEERRITRVQIKNAGVSLAISGVVIGFLFLLNNIQGV